MLCCEAKAEDKGHRRRYLVYRYESSSWGLPVAQKLGPRNTVLKTRKSQSADWRRNWGRDRVVKGCVRDGDG
jgi:hypothetical protein